MNKKMLCEDTLYPTALEACQGIVFIHGVWAGEWEMGKKFVCSDSSYGHWLGGVGVQCHGVTLI